MYNADRVFMNKLKRLDRRLGCKYDDDLERFVITRQVPWGRPASIMMVEAENERFRQPDDRDIMTLKGSDLHRDDYRKKFMGVAQYFEDYRRKIDKDRKDGFRNMTKDSKIQLMNAFSKAWGNGKANSTFRRIEHKSKGTAF